MNIKINQGRLIGFILLSITNYFVLMLIWNITKRFECAILMGIAFICAHVLGGE